MQRAAGTFGPVGLGAMLLSLDGRPARDQAFRTIHASLDAGVRLIDTADAYCRNAGDTGHNEVLVRDALAAWDGDPGSVLVATKGGHVRDSTGEWLVDGRPEHLFGAAQASRDRLGLERIALYQFHRPDPEVPFARSVGALVTLHDRGVIDSVGISNVSVEQAEVAIGMTPLASVQNELSPFSLQSLDVVGWCQEHDVRFLAWAPLGGTGRAPRLDDERFVSAFAAVARELGVSTAKVVLAWICSLAPVITVIPGARRAESAADSARAAALVPLGAAVLETLDAAVVPGGLPFARPEVWPA